MISGDDLSSLLSTNIPQVLGSLFAQSQKSKKLSHHFRVCFELVFGILNAPRKIFLAVYEPILKLQGLQGVGFQGITCLTKMVSNFSFVHRYCPHFFSALLLESKPHKFPSGQSLLS